MTITDIIYRLLEMIAVIWFFKCLSVCTSNKEDIIQTLNSTATYLRHLILRIVFKGKNNGNRVSDSDFPLPCLEYTHEAYHSIVKRN